jgi:hypothetical protein
MNASCSASSSRPLLVRRGWPPPATLTAVPRAATTPALPAMRLGRPRGLTTRPTPLRMPATRPRDRTMPDMQMDDPTRRDTRLLGPTKPGMGRHGRTIRAMAPLCQITRATWPHDPTTQAMRMPVRTSPVMPTCDPTRRATALHRRTTPAVETRVRTKRGVRATRLTGIRNGAGPHGTCAGSRTVMAGTPTANTVF